MGQCPGDYANPETPPRSRQHPACFAAQAFDEWLTRGSRQPLPGDIAATAQLLLEDARKRLNLDDQVRDSRRNADEERFGRRDWKELTSEEIQRRKEFSDRLSKEFPELLSPTFTRPQAEYDPAPTWPAPMNDRELDILLQHRNPKPSLDRFREREGISQPGAAREDRRRLQEFESDGGSTPLPA